MGCFLRLFVHWRGFCAFYHLLLCTWLFCLIIPERNNYVFLPRFCPLNEFNVTSIKRALLAKSKYEIHDGKSQLLRFDHFSTLFAPIPISPLSKLQLERNSGKKNQSAIVWSSCLGLVQLYHEGLWWKQGGAKWRSFVVDWRKSAQKRARLPAFIVTIISSVRSFYRDNHAGPARWQLRIRFQWAVIVVTSVPIWRNGTRRGVTQDWGKLVSLIITHFICTVRCS